MSKPVKSEPSKRATAAKARPRDDAPKPSAKPSAAKKRAKAPKAEPYPDFLAPSADDAIKATAALAAAHGEPKPPPRKGVINSLVRDPARVRSYRRRSGARDCRRGPAAARRRPRRA